MKKIKLTGSVIIKGMVLKSPSPKIEMLLKKLQAKKLYKQGKRGTLPIK